CDGQPSYLAHPVDLGGNGGPDVAAEALRRRDLAREPRAVRPGSKAHDDVPAAIRTQTVQRPRGEGGAVGERLWVRQAGKRRLPHDAERLRSGRTGDPDRVADRAVHGGEGLRTEGDLVVGL